MIIKSIKVTKWKLAAVIAAIGVLLCLIVWLAPGKSAAPESGAIATAGLEKPGDQAGEKEEQRVAFLASFGWEVEQPAAANVEVVIPAQFNETMTSYNELQKKQGYDLSDYQGKRVKRYTYQVLNYPDESAGEVAANLYVCEGKIIGGDISSTKLDGFMHGFNLE